MLNENYEHHPFEELLQEAQQGNDSAQNRLMQQIRDALRPGLEQTLGQKLQVRSDGSDLLQKVLMQVIRDLPHFRGESRGELMAWVRRILERDIQELLQREKYTSKRSIDREEDASHEVRQAIGQQTSPSQRVIRQEHQQLVHQAIEELDEDVREVMRLKHLDGETMAEIARQLSLSESSVARLLIKGMKQLKVILKQKGMTDT